MTADGCTPSLRGSCRWNRARSATIASTGLSTTIRVDGAPVSPASSGEIKTTPARDVANHCPYRRCARKLSWLGPARSSGAMPRTSIDPSPTSTPPSCVATAAAVMGSCPSPPPACGPSEPPRTAAVTPWAASWCSNRPGHSSDQRRAAWRQAAWRHPAQRAAPRDAAWRQRDR